MLRLVPRRLCDRATHGSVRRCYCILSKTSFSYVLGYSRRQYLHFVEGQDLATTIRQHIRAFEHLRSSGNMSL